jgi:cholesterol oxidase
LFDYRASTLLPSCRTSFSIDEIATDDWPAAVAEVRRRTGSDSVQLLGHCVGSVSILMALLAGLEGVRSAVCSQFTVHPHPGRLNRVKNALHMGELMEMARLRGIDDDSAPSAPNKLLDLALSVVPVPKGERCGRPVCRWLNATYGLTHAHGQLNEATHELLDEAFGFANVTGLKHLAQMNRKRRAVSRSGDDVYLPHVDRLSMPILFVQGRDNPIFRPEGTKATAAWIDAHHGTGHATYLELPAYAHLDTMIGRDAAHDVFPAIVAHLDASNS